MSSAWLLPEHIADVLPAQARRIEELRRGMLDVARSYGFELVMPPLLEYLESLLSGTGHELGLQTFKLVDQLSGRTMGLRADTTPQVARIDAHLLNRVGVTRLCYCGPVLHTRPAGPRATREPLQLGAEIYGHAGMEADLEILDLALASLHRAGVDHVTLDLADARVLQGLLDGAPLPADGMDRLCAALAAKDRGALDAFRGTLSAESFQGLQALAGLYGADEVLARAQAMLPRRPLIQQALTDLQWLAARITRSEPQVSVGFDLADLNGYAYYSGPRFAAYTPGYSDALLRGGRYDEVGAVFGRKRPAVGFSLDLKALVDCLPVQPPQPAIRAPWGDEAGLRAAVQALRAQGHTVVRVLPGHEDEVQEFACDRELVQADGRWTVRAC